MLKSNKTLLAIATASMALSASLAHAGTVTTTATITVQNAIAIVENAPLSFGTISVLAPTGGNGVDTAAAKLVIAADGSAPVATNGTPSTGNTAGKITKIVDGAPAEYAISGAPAFTNITVTVPSSAETLSNAAAPNGNGTFTVDGFTIYDVTNSEAASPITSDLSGNAVFRVGATLKATTTEDTPYIDGAYTGTFDVTVAY